MRFPRRPLRLEVLEDRTVPSLTTSLLYNGSLSISGMPRGELVIKHVGGFASSFHVTDNGLNVGTFNVLHDVYINLTYRVQDIVIDLNGGRIPGNVVINLGNGLLGSGNPGVSIFDDSGASPTGRIGGSVTIVRGNGFENVNIGSISGTVTPPYFPVTINGNVTVAAAVSGGTFGNSLIVDAGTRIGGSLSSSLISNVTIGSPASGSPLTSIGGTVSISDAGSLRPLSAVVTADVGGNLFVTGTNLDDSFTLGQLSPATPNSGLVQGSLSVNLASGQSNGDLITLEDNSQVNGNALLMAGGNLGVNPDLFRIGGTVNGNLTVNMGDGLNSLQFTEQQLGELVPPTVGGSMFYTAGNGSNTFFFGPDVPGDPQPMIFHNLFITLGSGDNGTQATPNIMAAYVGGTLTWHSGNGQNFVQLGNSSVDGNTENYIVNMVFGNENDYLAIDIGALGVISGRADGGGRNPLVPPFVNTFNDISGNYIGTLTLVNFP
jgi:hypothetical protein